MPAYDPLASWSPDETGLEEEPSLPELCDLCDREADYACAVCEALLCAYHVESQTGLCFQDGCGSHCSG